MFMSHLYAYILIYGDFCAHDDNNDNDNDNHTTDYFTPCACVRGNNSYSQCKHTMCFLLIRTIN